MMRTYLVILGLLLIPLFSTLVLPFATPDQLRNYRYGPVATDYQQCSAKVSSFYLETGRPLVWRGECLEHSLNLTFKQFWIFRLISLLLLTFACLILARRFVAKGWSKVTSVVGSVLVLLLPGVCFMLIQGGAATMIFAAMATLLLAMDFYLYPRNARQEALSFKDWLCNWRSAVLAAVYFAALSCYPTFAATVFLLPMFDVLTTDDKVWHQRRNALMACLSVLFATEVFYFAAYLVVGHGIPKEHLIAAGTEYEFSLGFRTILEKFGKLFTTHLWDSANLWFYETKPIVQYGVAGLILLSGLFYLRRNWKTQNISLQKLALLLVMLVALPSPWLFSHVPAGSDAYRYFYPFRCGLALIFFVALISGLVKAEQGLAWLARLRIARIAPAAILALVLAYVGAVQTLDAASLAFEYISVRAQIRNALLAQPGLNHVHVIDSRRFKLSSDEERRGELHLSMMGDPELAFQFTAAVFKELQSSEWNARYEFVSCGENFACDDKVPFNQRDLEEKRGVRWFKISFGRNSDVHQPTADPGLLVIDLTKMAWSL